MTNNTCIKIKWGATGRVAFAAQSMYARDWPGVEGARRPAVCDGVTRCAKHARNGSRPTEDARLRFAYACGSRPVCAMCLLPGSFAFAEGDVMRLEIAHTIPVVLFGASGAKVLHAAHVPCNAAAGDRDLRPFVPEVTQDWPSLKAAVAWAGTPHRRHLPDTVTAEQMAEARATRILPDGTVGLPF